MRFGFKAGANFSNVYDEEGQDFVADGKVGVAAGVFAQFLLENFLDFNQKLSIPKKDLKLKEAS